MDQPPAIVCEGVPLQADLRGLPGAVDYLCAAGAVCERNDPVPALRRAADAGHLVALVDLAALAGDQPPVAPRVNRWLRQHREIMAVAVEQPRRAEALLRDHVAEFGCDPVALFLVARRMDGLDGPRLSDLRVQFCGC